MALRGALPLIAGIALAPPLLAAVAELVPELRSHRPDIPQLARLDPQSERARLFDALAQLFVALARPRPLLVILEDLHRAGTATIEAIGGIVPRLSRSPVLIVATYRREEAGRSHPLRALEHASQPIAERVDVGPLNKPAVSLLVAAIVAQEPSAEFLTSLLRRSGGNPLFVTELLRDAGRAATESPVVPASVSAMITDRVASLASPGRAVAEIAAVAGEAFTVDIVREIAGLPEGELLDGLDELLDRHLIRESTERERYEYAFTHHLVHGAIYEAIPSGARARRHRRIARILDELVSDNLGERAGEIALHYERGRDAASAAVHYAAAAHRAARLHANAEARDLSSRALTLAPGSDLERYDLLLLRSRMSARLGDENAESTGLGELEQVAARCGVDAMCATLVRRIDLAFRSGNRAAEIETTERLTQHAVAARSERWLAAADEVRSRRQENDGEYGCSIESAFRARERYGALGDDVSRARVTAFAARVCSLMPGRASDAGHLASEAVSLAERVGDTEVRIQALRDASAVAQEQHDHVRAAELGRSALALGLEIGDRRFEADCRNILGVTSWSCWQIEDALYQLREARRLCESLGLTARLQGVMCDLGCVLIDVGNFTEAIEWCWRAADTTQDASISTAAVAAVNAADAAWQCGDIVALSRALEYAAPLVERLPESRFLGAFSQNRGRLLRCQREFDASTRELDRAFELHNRTGRWENAVEVLDDLAVTHLGGGRLAAARNALGRAVEMLRGRVGPYAIRHHWIDACVHRAAEEPGDARRAMQRAHEAYVKQLAALSDPGLRASFEAMPMHVALRAAVELDEWPPSDSPCVVAFPQAIDPPRHARRASRAPRA
jgi:tetratricopeptide (TPR) repeat protein